MVGVSFRLYKVSAYAKNIFRAVKKDARQLTQYLDVAAAHANRKNNTYIVYVQLYKDEAKRALKEDATGWGILHPLRFMSYFNQKTHEVSEKPPERIKMCYLASIVRRGAPTFCVHIPHLNYKMEGNKNVYTIKRKPIPLSFFIFNDQDVKLIEKHREVILQHPHLASNSVHETLGSIYALMHNSMYGGGYPLRNVLIHRPQTEDGKMVNSEFDTIFVGDRLNIYEIKSLGESYEKFHKRMDEKIKSHKRVLELLERTSIPYTYHLVVTGTDDKEIRHAIKEIRGKVKKLGKVTIHGFNVGKMVPVKRIEV